MLSPMSILALGLLWSSSLVLAQENPLCDGCTNCTIEGLCSNPYTTILSLNIQDQPPNSNATRWQLTLDQVPPERQCYNLQILSVRPDLSAGNFSSLEVSNANRFDSSANYSGIVYRQGYQYTEEGTFGDVVLQAYSSQGCSEDSDALADNVYTWNCAPGVNYTARIGISVKSFSIRPTTDEDRSGSCLIANFERRSSGGSVVGVGPVAVLAVTALTVVMGLL